MECVVPLPEVPRLRAKVPSGRTAAERVTPGGPGGPCGPGAPVCPRSDRRALVEISLRATARSRISADRTDLDRISDEPTPFVRICFAPTLLRGNCVTAYEVPPNATNNAKVAVTLA